MMKFPNREISQKYPVSMHTKELLFLQQRHVHVPSSYYLIILMSYMQTQDPGTFGSAGMYVPTEVGLAKFIIIFCYTFSFSFQFLFLMNGTAYHIIVPSTGAENCSWESLRNVGGDSIWVAVPCVVPSVSFPGCIPQFPLYK